MKTINAVGSNVDDADHVARSVIGPWHAGVHPPAGAFTLDTPDAYSVGLVAQFTSVLWVCAIGASVGGPLPGRDFALQDLAALLFSSGERKRILWSVARGALVGLCLDRRRGCVWAAQASETSSAPQLVQRIFVSWMMRVCCKA